MRPPNTELCLYPRALPAPFGGLHGHFPLSPWDDPWPLDARWTYGDNHCCDLCDMWLQIPEADVILDELSLWDPYEHARLVQLYENIHHHFMMGYNRDGSESFWLSRDLEKLSRRMQRLYHRHPCADRRVAGLAGHLKHAGRDLQIGRRRKGFHMRPGPRYYSGEYYPGELFGPHYR
ncbi:hypothetical protein FB567DRAFT_142882 [Paraphoma chrysanthemicola]|uniref:Uncharacterized protein n=1 Tax=Paraphoma chrysanthemicola TaxID=798071 RepID=A0A8K0VU90_9PLEO|nr:hypothetical protein FB567DRAFT_142882 [Paraphoma chrysanthemicola]